jgi:flagellar biosynthesis GTPase FlhF
VEQNERAYWTKEVADRLQIGQSTLRKYCLHLEENGYQFTKGQRGSRAFLERDIGVLAKMRDVLNQQGTTFEDAVAVAMGERGVTGMHVAIPPQESVNEQENWQSHVATAFQIAEQLLEQQKTELLEIVRETLRQQETLAIEREEERERRAVEREKERESRAIEREGEREKRAIDREKERISQRDKQFTELLQIQREIKQAQLEAAASKKGFFARLFGK